jgi:multicomponent Na+:H+ antiporter subunit E
MKFTIPTFILLCIIWLIWSGHYDAKMLMFGLFSCLCVLFITLRMDNHDETRHFDIGTILRSIFYLPWLSYKIFRANIDVARIILHPDLPIDPRLVRLKASQKSELGQVIYANSITLTPGTITLDLREGRLVVHALTKEGETELLQGEMDRRVVRLERGGNV